MTNNDITIIGGGIAGLTTAIALKKIGIATQIFEANDQMLPVGAGLGLGSNALKALKAIGLEEEVIRAGKLMTGFSIFDEKGKIITNTRFYTENNQSNLAIHRADLQSILISKLDPDTIHPGKKLKAFHHTSTGLHLTFTDGSEIKTKFLIVADGIHSIVRKTLLNNSTPRYAGYTCWRGVANFPALTGNMSSETWSKNGRFGIVPLTENKVYWFACVNAKYNDAKFRKYGVPELLNHFQNFHSPIPEILSRTQSENLLHNDIIDLKPIDQYAFGRIVLLGDAAHATTPNMGQGACQAIEDAVTLAKCMREFPDFVSAFVQFEKQRLERTHWITKSSWRIGKVAQIDNPLLIRLRDAGFRILPESIANKQLKKLEEIDF